MLLLLSLLAVGGATLSGSWLVAMIASYTAVALGVTATRLTYVEVADTRREAACDRAQQAQDYLALTQVRTAEQAIYVADTVGRLAARQAQIDTLQGRLTAACDELADLGRIAVEQRGRAERAESDGSSLRVRLDDADERAAIAIVRVAELEQELDVVLAEWSNGRAAPQRKHA